MDNWTRRTRMIICMVVAFPLAISMVTVGAVSIERCSIQETSISSNVTITDNSLPLNQTKGTQYTSFLYLAYVFTYMYLLQI